MLRKVTISGSYSKFRKELEDAIAEFQRLGVEVLSPKSAEIVSVCRQAYSLEGDVVPRIDLVDRHNFSKALKAVEDSHLAAIARSEALWVIANEGYLGNSACLEIGWAISSGIPVFYDSRFSSKIDAGVKQFMAPVETIERLVKSFESAPLLYIVQGRKVYESCKIG